MGKSKLQITKINAVTSFLSKSLPQNPTVDENLYALPSKINERYANSDRRELIAQELSNHIGFYLGIIHPIKVIFVEDDKGSFDFQVDQKGNAQGKNIHYFAGLYSSKFIGKNHITIANELIYRFPNLAAILAHEYTHHYLHLKNIKCKIVDDESFTDLTAVFLGFGFLLLHGYEKYGISIGYIDDETIKKTIFLSSRYRNWGKTNIRKQFDSYYDKLRLYIYSGL